MSVHLCIYDIYIQQLGQFHKKVNSIWFIMLFRHQLINSILNIIFFTNVYYSNGKLKGILFFKCIHFLLYIIYVHVDLFFVSH